MRQLLTLSSTFAYPFTTERRVQERLHRLTAAGRVHRWHYATAGQGSLSYFTLSGLGYRLLHPDREAPVSRGLFSAVGVARQAHTQSLAQVLVHFFVAAHQSATTVTEFHRENALRLTCEGESLYPDATFELSPRDGVRFRFFVELDNASETVAGLADLDSLGRKLAFYERYQDTLTERFRVLVITTAGPRRVENILQAAKTAARNPQRSLAYAATLRDFLAASEPLSAACFHNHRTEAVAMLSTAFKPIGILGRDTERQCLASDHLVIPMCQK